MTTIYHKQPLNTISGIPIFSETSDYIANYEQIATDFLASVEKTGQNPFMEEDYWKELETSTIKILNKYIDNNSRILDVGVGIGRLLTYLPNKKKHGIDISLEQLKIAKEKGIDVCFSSVEDMPYNENLFDIILCTDVLEHVLDLNASIKNILNVLKPAGYLIIRVPYSEILAPYLNKNYPYKYAHLRNFDEYSLQLLFTRIFKCEFIEYSTAGYVEYSNRLLHFSKNRLIAGLINYSVKFTKKINHAFHKFLLKSLYKPLEINFVVRKI